MLTLNFDMAITSAIAQLGLANIAVIAGPEDHDKLADTNIIFLHRNAFADPEN